MEGIKFNLQSFLIGTVIGLINGALLYKVLTNKREKKNETLLLPQLHISIQDIITRAERLYSKKIATIDASSGERKTYGEFCLNVKALATGLVKELQLKEGDRVATLLLNCCEYLELYFACPWAGVMVVPQNTRLTAVEIIFCLNRYI